jgi:hypothetical protein
MAAGERRGLQSLRSARLVAEHGPFGLPAHAGGSIPPALACRSDRCHDRQRMCVSRCASCAEPDCILDVLLRAIDKPLSRKELRERYIGLAYANDPPKHWGAELEVELPEPLRILHSSTANNNRAVRLSWSWWGPNLYEVSRSRHQKPH